MMNRLDYVKCYDIHELEFERRELLNEIKSRKAAADKEFEDGAYLASVDDLRRLSELVANLGWCEDRIKTLKTSGLIN